jgi:hypothetical protein
MAANGWDRGMRMTSPPNATHKDAACVVLPARFFARICWLMRDDRGCGHSEDKFVADGAGLQVVRQRSYVGSLRSAVTHLLRGRRLSQWLIIVACLEHRETQGGIRRALSTRWQER